MSVDTAGAPNGAEGAYCGILKGCRSCCCRCWEALVSILPTPACEVLICCSILFLFHLLIITTIIIRTVTLPTIMAVLTVTPATIADVESTEKTIINNIQLWLKFHLPLSAFTQVVFVVELLGNHSATKEWAVNVNDSKVLTRY